MFSRTDLDIPYDVRASLDGDALTISLVGHGAPDAAGFTQEAFNARVDLSGIADSLATYAVRLHFAAGDLQMLTFVATDPVESVLVDDAPVDLFDAHLSAKSAANIRIGTIVTTPGVHTLRTLTTNGTGSARTITVNSPPPTS